MTEPGCIPIEELARVRDLPAGAPERVHAEGCPRCRAALLALAEFEQGDAALPASARAEEARVRLDAVIDSLTSSGPDVPAPARAREARAPRRLAWWFAPPAVRFAGAFAVLALVAASAWFLARGPAPARERVVRGEAPELARVAVRATATGWELRWAPVPGADSYDVVFLDAGLHEVARRDGLREPRLALTRDSLPPGVSPGVTMLVEIGARAGGDLMRDAVPAAIRLD